MKIFIFLSLSLFLNIGRCEWVKITEDEFKNEYFYESSKTEVSLRPDREVEDKKITGWIMSNFGKPFVMKYNKKINSQKDNFEIQCKVKLNPSEQRFFGRPYFPESYRLIYSTFYPEKNGLGGVIHSQDYNGGVEQKIVPGSMIEYFVDYFCKR